MSSEPPSANNPLLAMASLEGWIPATPTLPSFRRLFTIQVDLPPDRTTSYSNKRTTIEEESGSGPSLHRLATFDLRHLYLSRREHNFTWAENILGEYGPLDPRGWDHRDIEVGLPSYIDSEANTLAFVESAYLRRALCAGWFLYCHSATNPPSRCPITRILYWHDTSSFGASGRPDRTLFFHDRAAQLVEGKTDKVCQSSDIRGASVNVLHELYRFAASFHEGPDVSNWLRAENHRWETKGRQFLLQVWIIRLLIS